MFDWVFDVPLWIVGPGLVVLLGGVSLAGLLAVRSRILPRMRVTPEDSHFVGTLVHSIMVFYGLVLALIAVNVFETYSESSQHRLGRGHRHRHALPGRRKLPRAGPLRAPDGAAGATSST